jgi:4-hydroxy-L-threonine phosphate dehydrogenase PdxA
MFQSVSEFRVSSELTKIP